MIMSCPCKGTWEEMCRKLALWLLSKYDPLEFNTISYLCWLCIFSSKKKTKVQEKGQLMLCPVVVLIWIMNHSPVFSLCIGEGEFQLASNGSFFTSVDRVRGVHNLDWYYGGGPSVQPPYLL